MEKLENLRMVGKVTGKGKVWKSWNMCSCMWLVIVLDTEYARKELLLQPNRIVNYAVGVY